MPDLIDKSDSHGNNTKLELIRDGVLSFVLAVPAYYLVLYIFTIFFPKSTITLNLNFSGNIEIDQNELKPVSLSPICGCRRIFPLMNTHVF